MFFFFACGRRERKREIQMEGWKKERWEGERKDKGKAEGD